MSRTGIVQVAFACVAMVLLAACQQTAAPPVAADVGTAPATSASAEEYQLGNGDGLRVTVFGEPDLTGEYVVDGVGNISMPLIGSFKVSGLTVQEFQQSAQSLYRDGDFLRDPQISAEVTTFRPFYILGEVNNPGEYPYSSGLTVFNAVATAQGFTYRANRKVVFIRSDGSDVERRVDITNTTLVQPGDTIRIAERFF